MSLKSQRRLASEILKTGVNSVCFDPEKVEDAKGVITREEVRKLIHEGVIKAASKRGTSRVRARIIHVKKRHGLRKGAGNKTGASTARMPRKTSWENKIRAIRRHLKVQKTHRVLRGESYRKLYLMSKGGAFSSVANVEQYINAHKLERRR